MFHTLLIGLALAYVCLFALSLKKVIRSGDDYKFIYGWGFLVGAFVWEDVVVFAPLFFLITLTTLLAQDIRVGLFLFLLFWVVRSSGETLYFFLEQFLEPKYQPHNIRTHLLIVQKMFGGISLQKSFILMQIFFQSIDFACIACLIWLLHNWQTIPAWL